MTPARAPRRAAHLLAACALLVFMAGPGASATAGQRKPVTVTVTIDATSYQPETLIAHAGDTIVWVNRDIIPHTVTSKPDKIASGSIAAGESFRLTVRTKGQIAYGCDFHPTMKGTMIVR